MLSTSIRKDYVINHSPEGYRLEGKCELFRSIQEMIAHYQRFPIEEHLVLGGSRTASGMNHEHNYR
jgi:dihydrofolate reductase